MKIGDKIMVDHYLRRSRKFVSRDITYKYWKKCKTEKEKEVFFVSEVILSNGYTDYDPSAGYNYVRKETVRAYLVTNDLKSKPFYILRGKLK